MKKLFVILICLLLSGCSSIDYEPIDLNISTNYDLDVFGNSMEKEVYDYEETYVDDYWFPLFLHPIDVEEGISQLYSVKDEPDIEGKQQKYTYVAIPNSITFFNSHNADGTDNNTIYYLERVIEKNNELVTIENKAYYPNGLLTENSIFIYTIDQIYNPYSLKTNSYDNYYRVETYGCYTKNQIDPNHYSGYYNANETLNNGNKNTYISLEFDLNKNCTNKTIHTNQLNIDIDSLKIPDFNESVNVDLINKTMEVFNTVEDEEYEDTFGSTTTVFTTKVYKEKTKYDFVIKYVNENVSTYNVEYTANNNAKINIEINGDGNVTCYHNTKNGINKKAFYDYLEDKIEVQAYMDNNIETFYFDYDGNRITD